MKRSASRPARLRGSRGRRIRATLGARDGLRCFYCRAPFQSSDDATIDHYLPCAFGPVHRQWNLVLACEPCNVRKQHTLPLGLFLALRPLLDRTRLEVAA